MGGRTTPAPLTGAHPVDDGIRGAFEKAKPKDAPPVDPDEERPRTASIPRHGAGDENPSAGDNIKRRLRAGCRRVMCGAA